ncbi:Pfam:DUF821 [Seminavis robusta]|uniref:Pfam:DUF821 n=1 Tax=Seminavis robusta TaxID=568900 RepID=A0A9N8E789_9STRA|nr:Pfam:DUF821 [Seminavis robusta]|eukprot:Sro588_g171480.1 Pfam:DUF821 (375) ;mRNA; r:15437-16661
METAPFAGDTVSSVVAAVIIYKLIIPNRGSVGAYLLGWGVIIPLSLWIPFEMMEAFDLRNKILKMCVSLVPMIVVFRSIEAMYDTSPPVVEYSLANYVTYYTCTIHHVWDPKTNGRVRVNTQQFISTFLRVVYYYHLQSLSLSFQMHVDFKPFKSDPVVLDEFHVTRFWELLRPDHIANAYLIVLHLYFYLLVGFELTNFGENIKGYLTKPTFKNPIWTSKSPTDFWGRKWNLLIHDILKGGAFLPARKYVSTPLAVMWSFICSGLMHDYMWAVIFYHHGYEKDPETGICEDCFSPSPLKLTAFFVWNAMMMLLERPVSRWAPMQWMANNLPLTIISSLVGLTALPVTHWYTGDWAVGGFFADYAVALWAIKKL